MKNLPALRVHQFGGTQTDTANWFTSGKIERVKNLDFVYQLTIRASYVNNVGSKPVNLYCIRSGCSLAIAKYLASKD
ncbi:MAG: hypothetical protein ACHBN1_00265 [Heteroscytonema crispum UTEX LB 1556]